MSATRNVCHFLLSFSLLAAGPWAGAQSSSDATTETATPSTSTPSTATPADTTSSDVTPPNGSNAAPAGSTNPNDQCPTASADDPVQVCARKSCLAIKACGLVATHAENQSAIAASDVSDQFADSPDMALSSFKFSALGSDTTQWYAQAFQYCQGKPTQVCKTECADSKSDDQDAKDKLKASRKKCLIAINANLTTLGAGMKSSSAAATGGNTTGTQAGATPQSTNPSNTNSNPAPKASDQANSSMGSGMGGMGGMGGMSMPTMPQSNSSSSTAASTTPDCTYDMSSATCVSQWTSQCSTNTYAGSSACQSFMGSHCVGATLHAAECISYKTILVCSTPTGAAGCPVCMQQRGVAVSALQSSVPAICNEIPSPAAASTTTAAGASVPQSTSSSSASSGLNTSSIQTQSVSTNSDTLTGSESVAVKRTTASESAEGRPASDVEKVNGLGVMSITDEVLSKFCKGSMSPSCTGGN